VEVTKYKYYLDGKLVTPPVESFDINISARFPDDEVQAEIDASEFTFVNDSAQQIYDYIRTKGAFQGMPFKIALSQGSDSFTAFDGYLDLTDGFTGLSPVKAQAKMKQRSGTDSIIERLEGLTVALLESKGVFTDADYQDVDFIITKKKNFIEIAMTSIVIYLMVKEVAESIQRIADRIATGTSTAATGVLGPVAAAIYFGLTILIEAAYIVAMVVNIINLAADIFTTLIPPVSTNKAIKLDVLLTKITQYLGLEFESPIEELSKFALMPSQPYDETGQSFFQVLPKPNTTDKGIPSANDFGYQCSEAFELCKRLFNARTAVIDGKLHLRWKGDSFWIKQADYQAPGTLTEKEQVQYNTEEFTASTLLSFRTDVSDEWTVEDFTGTNYAVNQTPNTVFDPELVLSKGFKEVNFNVALGSRKTGLNGLEKTLIKLAKPIESILKVFGSSKKFSDKIKQRVGLLQMTTDTYNVAKLLSMNGNRLSASSREDLSAETLYNKYHSWDSFVLNNFNGQKSVYTGIRIPFNFEDFLKVVKNSYFTLSDGRIGKFTNIEWNINGDFAQADYWVREPYDTNLIETGFAP